MRGTVRSLAALLSLSVLAACGAGPSDEQQVRDTLAAFGRATARHDYAARVSRTCCSSLGPAPQAASTLRDSSAARERTVPRTGAL